MTAKALYTTRSTHSTALPIDPATTARRCAGEERVREPRSRTSRAAELRARTFVPMCCSLGRNMRATSKLLRREASGLR